MKYRFFSIPAWDPAASQDELNRFLGAHRVLSVDREFVTDGRHSLWCLCVSYADGETATTPRSKARIDYREVLNDADFAVFAELRTLRKQLAEAEGLPAYALFTNEQLAEMVRKRVDSVANLEAIAGVGKARVEKYGVAFIDLLRRAWARPTGDSVGGADA